MDIDVDIAFWGGAGEVSMRLVKDGITLQSFVITESGTRTFAANGPGFYVIAAAFRPSPPGGTDITIHTLTTPVTPQRIPPGICFKNYSFSIKNQ